MAIQIFWENDYIIQIDDRPVEVKIPEAGLHQPLKGHRGIG